MIPAHWDLAPECVCGPNLISDSIGDSPILPAIRSSWHPPRDLQQEGELQQELDRKSSCNKKYPRLATRTRLQVHFAVAPPQVGKI